jgi:uracil-DNA glycosylase
MLSSQDIHTKLAESVHAWWRDAGVDYVTNGSAMNWLAPAAPRQATPEIPKPKPINPPAAAFVPKPALREWPNDIAALKAAIADMPGGNYGTHCIAPTGEMGATAFIVGDMPEEEEIAAGAFGSGPVARLLINMLLAAQFLPDLTYQTNLAHSRPATASLPKDDVPALADFVRHQIRLVQPQVVILFGTAACDALLGQELMQARGNLHYINHHDRKTAAIATFHPRTLMAQPQLKAQAWKDLQMLARKDYL